MESVLFRLFSADRPPRRLEPIEHTQRVHPFLTNHRTKNGYDLSNLRQDLSDFGYTDEQIDEIILKGGRGRKVSKLDKILNEMELDRIDNTLRKEILEYIKEEDIQNEDQLITELVPRPDSYMFERAYRGPSSAEVELKKILLGHPKLWDWKISEIRRGRHENSQDSKDLYTTDNEIKDFFMKFKLAFGDDVTIESLIDWLKQKEHEDFNKLQVDLPNMFPWAIQRFRKGLESRSNLRDALCDDIVKWSMRGLDLDKTHKRKKALEYIQNIVQYKDDDDTLKDLSNSSKDLKTCLINNPEFWVWSVSDVMSQNAPQPSNSVDDVDDVDDVDVHKILEKYGDLLDDSFDTLKLQPHLDQIIEYMRDNLKSITDKLLEKDDAYKGAPWVVSEDLFKLDSVGFFDQRKPLYELGNGAETSDEDFKAAMNAFRSLYELPHEFSMRRSIAFFIGCLKDKFNVLPYSKTCNMSIVQYCKHLHTLLSREDYKQKKCRDFLDLNNYNQ